jgi:hypothetical protein
MKTLRACIVEAIQHYTPESFDQTAAGGYQALAFIRILEITDKVLDRTAQAKARGADPFLAIRDWCLEGLNGLHDPAPLEIAPDPIKDAQADAVAAALAHDDQAYAEAREREAAARRPVSLVRQAA